MKSPAVTDGGDDKLLERRSVHGTFRRREEEPALALCGFDSNPARRDLASAQFRRVVESGLGGTAANVDTVSLHALPNPRLPAELRPDPSEEERRKHAEHLGRASEILSGCGSHKTCSSGAPQLKDNRTSFEPLTGTFADYRPVNGWKNGATQSGMATHQPATFFPFERAAAALREREFARLRDVVPQASKPCAR